jgi:hypothetical protein
VMVVRNLSFREAVRLLDEYLHSSPGAKQNPAVASLNPDFAIAR